MDDFIVKPIVEKTIAVSLNKWLHFLGNNPVSGPAAVEEDDTLHFDPDRIKLYAGNDEAVLNELITLAKAELIQSQALFLEHIKNENIKGLNQTGHKLYGTALSVGLPVVARFAHEFERIADFNNKDAIDELLLSTIAEINLVLGLMHP